MKFILLESIFVRCSLIYENLQRFLNSTIFTQTYIIVTNYLPEIKGRSQWPSGWQFWHLITGCHLCVVSTPRYRVRNLKFARNLKFTTSKTLVNFMKKMLFLSKNWHFSVQKALNYYTFNKSHHNSYILIVFSHVANFRYVANIRFLTLVNVPIRPWIVEMDVKHKL